MPVWVAKVDARSAGWPDKGAFRGNAALGEPRLPRRQPFRRDAEADVSRASTAMRGDKPEGQRRSLWIAATTKKNQHLARPNAEGAEAVIRLHDSITEKSGVEIA